MEQGPNNPPTRIEMRSVQELLQRFLRAETVIQERARWQKHLLHQTY